MGGHFFLLTETAMRTTLNKPMLFMRFPRCQWSAWSTHTLSLACLAVPMCYTFFGSLIMRLQCRYLVRPFLHMFFVDPFWGGGAYDLVQVLVRGLYKTLQIHLWHPKYRQVIMFSPGFERIHRLFWMWHLTFWWFKGHLAIWSY